MTVHLQLGRWAGDALTLKISGGQKLNAEIIHLCSRPLNLDVSCLQWASRTSHYRHALP